MLPQQLWSLYDLTDGEIEELGRQTLESMAPSERSSFEQRVAFLEGNYELWTYEYLNGLEFSSEQGTWRDFGS